MGDIPQNIQIVNVKVKYIRPEFQNLQEWMQDPENLYIGRRGVVFIDGKRFPPADSPYHNPYKIGRDGDRQEVIQKYAGYLESHPELVEQARRDFVGKKRLGCWCKTDGLAEFENYVCHGDVLLAMVSGN